MSNLAPALEQNIVRAQLDMQISTAKAYPRDVKLFLNQAIEYATIDQETAESCIYAVPRKDKEGNQKLIKGESVRLAEIIASTWGNLHAGSRLTDNDGKTVTAEGAAWDLEKNLKITKEVKRNIVNSHGKTFSQDMQVMTGNAAQSLALRNAIFSVVPKAFVKKVYDAAVKHAIGDQSKLSVTVEKLVERFHKMGVEKEKILKYFDKKNISELADQDTIEEMIGIGTSIKEGNLKIDNAFSFEETISKISDLENKLAD